MLSTAIAPYITPESAFISGSDFFLRAWPGRLAHQDQARKLEGSPLPARHRSSGPTLPGLGLKLASDGTPARGGAPLAAAGPGAGPTRTDLVPVCNEPDVQVVQIKPSLYRVVVKVGPYRLRPGPLRRLSLSGHCDPSTSSSQSKSVTVKQRVKRKAVCDSKQFPVASGRGREKSKTGKKNLGIKDSGHSKTFQ